MAVLVDQSSIFKRGRTSFGVFVYVVNLCLLPNHFRIADGATLPFTIIDDLSFQDSE